MKKFFYIIWLQVFKTLISVRFLVAVLFISIFSLLELLGLRAMAVYFNLSVNYSAVSLMFSDSFFLTIFFLVCFLLFSSFPYRDEQQIQLVLKTGKRLWLLSHIVVVIVVALILVLCTLCFSFFVLNGRLDFSNEWGRVLGTLGQQPHFKIPFSIEYDYSYYVQIHLSPFDAFVRSTGLLLGVIVLMGGSMILFNTLTPGSAAFIGGGIIFIHILSSYVLEYYFYFISPISWVSLTKTSVESASALPSLPYILGSLGILNSIVVGALCVVSNKKSKWNVF